MIRDVTFVSKGLVVDYISLNMEGVVGCEVE